MPWRPVPVAPEGKELEAGSVYVLHFSEPFGHAKHYIGFATDPKARIAAHRHGLGAKLTHHVVAAGIDLLVASVIPGDRATERRLKNRGDASRHCAICKTGQPAASARGFNPRRKAVAA